MQERDDARMLLNTMQLQYVPSPNGVVTKTVPTTSTSTAIAQSSASTSATTTSEASTSATIAAKESNDHSSRSHDNSADSSGSNGSVSAPLSSAVVSELVEKCAELSSHRKGRKGKNEMDHHYITYTLIMTIVIIMSIFTNNITFPFVPHH